MKHSKRVIVGLAIGMALQGCVSSSGVASTSAVDNWKLSGKIAAVYPKTNCQKDECSPHSDQGKINWQQKGETYRIAVSDPFGRVVIELVGDNDKLTAMTPGQQAPISTSPEDFLTLLVSKNEQSQALTDLTANNLRYWVTGRISPTAGAVKKQASGHSFEQKGYLVTTKQWRATEIGQLPSLVNIAKGKFKLRFVIRDWNKAD